MVSSIFFPTVDTHSTNFASGTLWSENRLTSHIDQKTNFDHKVVKMWRKKKKIPELMKQNSSFDCHCDPVRQETWVQSLGWEAPWRREWQPIPVFLQGKFNGQRSLMGYSPWSCKRVRHDWETGQMNMRIFLYRQNYYFSTPYEY